MRILALSIFSVGLLVKAAFADPPPPADSTPEFERLAPAELVLEIECAQDFFRWYELRESVLRRNLDDPAIPEALEKTEERLREQFPPKQIHENLELLGFRWWIHSLRDDGLARYRANWLFHPIEKTEFEEGESLRLLLVARPKLDQAHLLAYERERESGVIRGTLRLDPPVSEWASDSYHLIMIPFAAPIVPFRMETYFIRKREDRILGSWGRRIDLGWYVDFPK